MIQEIIRYPSPPSVEFAVDVRVFDENILSLIDDLIDTAKANKLDGLSAFQIGSYYNIIVIKNNDGSYMELINPRILRKEGSITTTETTAYFPGLSANIKRYDKISVIYQDKDANDNSLQAEGDKSALIQRKIDFTHGATFVQKMDSEEKASFEKQLEFGADIAVPESCPTTFIRDKILKLVHILTALMLVPIIISFFISEEQMLQTLWDYQLYGSLGLVFLNAIYFIYAYYEGKKYSACSSCQVGNIIGTTAISLFRLSLIILLSYFIVNPL